MQVSWTTPRRGGSEEKPRSIQSSGVHEKQPVRTAEIQAGRGVDTATNTKTQVQSLYK